MDGILGEIRLFAGNFAPRNWALCEGQLLPIRNYTAVFSLLGVYYGGDGRTTFALPDLRGRMAIGTGQGAGLSGYSMGESRGVEGFTMTANNLPLHTHTITGNVTVNGTAAGGNADGPQDKYPAALADTDMYSTGTDGTFMANMQHNLGTGSIGSSTPVSNIQPMLGLTFVICMAGVFPQRP